MLKMMALKNYWYGLNAVAYRLCFDQTRQKVGYEARQHLQLRQGAPAVLLVDLDLHDHCREAQLGGVR